MLASPFGTPPAETQGRLLKVVAMLERDPTPDSWVQKPPIVFAMKVAEGFGVLYYFANTDPENVILDIVAFDEYDDGG